MKAWQPFDPAPFDFLSLRAGGVFGNFSELWQIR